MRFTGRWGYETGVMNEIKKIKNQLQEFKTTDKFITYGHLQPAVENSTEEDKQYVNNKMNECADRVLGYLDQPDIKEEKLEEIIRATSLELEQAPLDTEDWEFCNELLYVLDGILGLNVNAGKSQEEKMLETMQSLLRRAGINPDDLDKFKP